MCRQRHRLAVHDNLVILHIVLVRDDLDVVVLDDDCAGSTAEGHLIYVTCELRLEHLLHVRLAAVLVLVPRLRATRQVIALADDVRVRRVDDLVTLLLALINVFNTDVDVIEVYLLHELPSRVKVLHLLTVLHQSLSVLSALFQA